LSHRINRIGVSWSDSIEIENEWNEKEKNPEEF
jgi:hypothetical protein